MKQMYQYLPFSSRVNYVRKRDNTTFNLRPRARMIFTIMIIMLLRAVVQFARVDFS